MAWPGVMAWKTIIFNENNVNMAYQSM
jgi:hypothetical protein